MQPHLMARPVLDRGGAADRLRNHLRRRAITRLGLIEGDLYMLPYWRAAGRGPEGETTFHLLAAELGDARLLRVNLPAADLHPFEPASAPSEALVVHASRSERAITVKAASIGWRVDALEELIHYPFWLMRVEDSGRFEGAWIDGVEGRVIHHALKVPAPIPTVKQSAIMLAAPAALMAAAALSTDDLVLLAAATAFVASAGGAMMTWLMQRDARRDRKG